MLPFAGGLTELADARSTWPRGCSANIDGAGGTTATGPRMPGDRFTTCCGSGRLLDFRPLNKFRSHAGDGTAGLGNSSSPSVNDSRMPAKVPGSPPDLPEGPFPPPRTRVPPCKGGAAVAGILISSGAPPRADSGCTDGPCSTAVTGPGASPRTTRPRIRGRIESSIGGGTGRIPASRSFGIAGTGSATT